MKRVKPKKKKSKKKRRKDNQRKERKATQTLAIVLGENLCNKTPGIIRNFLRSKQRQTSIHSFYSPPDPNKCKSSSSSSSSSPPASFLVCWLPFFTCNILDALSIKFELNTAPGNFLFQVSMLKVSMKLNQLNLFPQHWQPKSFMREFWRIQKICDLI